MLEKNNSVFSLHLQQRASLDVGISIGADKLLSVEDQLVKVEGEQPPAAESPAEQRDHVLQIGQEDARYLVEMFGLNEVRGGTDVISSDETEHRSGRSAEDTKNILRNFGNAQNQYVLYNPRAQEAIARRVEDPARFHRWVRHLKLDNFQQFKRVWQGDERQPEVYTRLYRELCWQFYRDEAACYVLSSRMKNEGTRATHLKYIYRFLEGLTNPEDFYYFKKA